jgi:cytohesin
VTSDPKALALDQLAKYGLFAEFCRRAAAIKDVDLASIFERAVADFRTVRRNPGHQKILHWCLERGLDLKARAGWLNQPVVCLAAAAGNNEIIAVMERAGFPDDPFVRAAVGDVEFLDGYGTRHQLAGLRDENGFNLLCYCAGSGLGRRDGRMGRRLAEVCRLLLDRGVNPGHEVTFGLPIFPAFLCASSGGNGEVMRQLLDHGGLAAGRVHLVVEHALEPHQRSGEPFYHIAELIVRRGFDVNEKTGRVRTLLHGAANRGTIKAVRWLLENGAEPNALDDAGRTPLHVCAERNTSAAVVKLLIAAGSEPAAKDPSGQTPLDYARRNRRDKVADYLSSLGGR